MEKEEFVKILGKNKIPANIHDKWWENLKQHHFIFCCSDSDSNALIDFYVKEAIKAMEKRQATGAPW